jgi:hypothetical protein
MKLQSGVMIIVIFSLVLFTACGTSQGIIGNSGVSKLSGCWQTSTPNPKTQQPIIIDFDQEGNAIVRGLSNPNLPDMAILRYSYNSSSLLLMNKREGDTWGASSVEYRLVPAKAFMTIKNSNFDGLLSDGYSFIPCNNTEAPKRTTYAETKCFEPAIQKDYSCCLDVNKNNLCDDEEPNAFQNERPIQPSLARSGVGDHICGWYETEVNTILCFDPNPNNGIYPKLCDTKPKIWKDGQGQPLAITSVIQEDSPTGTYVTINLKQMMPGTIYDELSMPTNFKYSLYACNESGNISIPGNAVSVIHIKNISIDGTSLECKPNEIVGLDRVVHVGLIICKYPNPLLGNEIISKTLTVKLSYAYDKD